MEIESKNFYRIFSALLFKSDISKELEDFKNFLSKDKIVNKSFTGVTGGDVEEIKFHGKIRDNKVLIEDDDIISNIFLCCLYFDNVEGRFKEKSAYPIENILCFYDHPTNTIELEEFQNESLLTYCDKNLNVGCKFTLDEVKQKFNNLNNSDLYFSYRLSNCLGELTNVLDSKSKNFSVLRKVPTLILEEKYTDQSDILIRCIEYMEYYSEISSSESLLPLYTQSLSLCSLIYLLLPAEERDKLYANEIFLGCLYTLLSDHIDEKDTLKLRDNILNDFIDEHLNTLKKLFSFGFETDFKKVIKSEEFSARQLFEVNELRQLLLEESAKGVNAKSYAQSLSDTSDLVMENIICDYFKIFFKISHPELAVALTLVFFSFMSTSPNIRKRNEEFKFNYISDDGKERVGKIKSKHFVGYIDSRKNELSFRDKERNYIRLFCSKRANLAIRVNEKFKFQPTVMDKCPKVLPYMKIDFYKGLKATLLTKEETESLAHLKLYTDYVSNNSKFSKDKYFDYLMKPT
uniref:Viral heat shock protein HSP90 n=1 Tax=Little cherry virus 1 TaxID=217686 RepID=A0A517BB98_9CLOS|nr:viral heat shock protein HSP90 [Little cherry virus 1]